MPWSEWITPEPSETVVHGVHQFAYSRKLIEYIGGGPDADVVFGNALAAARDGFEVADTGIYIGQMFISDAADENAALSGDITSGDAQIQQTIHTMKPSLDPETWHDSFPEYLNDLTEGVDYGIIPGKDPFVDEFAYVEYEESGNELLGWEPDPVADDQRWVITLEGAINRSHSPIYAEEVTPQAIPYRVAIVDPLEPGESMGWPAWGVGTDANLPFQDDPSILTIAWLIANATGGEFIVDLSEVPPHFGLLLQPTDMHPLFEAHAVARTPPPNTSSGTQHQQIFDVIEDVTYSAMPRYRFQMPRYRYWIPSDPPLRQRQRNDGLGMSGTRRWKGGTSVQSSNRWRGYR